MKCKRCKEQVPHDRTYGEYFDRSCFRIQGYSCACGYDTRSKAHIDLDTLPDPYVWFNWMKI